MKKNYRISKLHKKISAMKKTRGHGTGRLIKKIKVPVAKPSHCLTLSVNKPSIFSYCLPPPPPQQQHQQPQHQPQHQQSLPSPQHQQQQQQQQPHNIDCSKDLPTFGPTSTLPQIFSVHHDEEISFLYALPPPPIKNIKPLPSPQPSPQFQNNQNSHKVFPLEKVHQKLKEMRPLPALPLISSPISSPVSSPVSSNSLQKKEKGIDNFNVHLYTNQVNEMLSHYIPDLTKEYGDKVDSKEFNNIIQELKTTYGPKVTYNNLKNIYRDGWIRDPHVKNMNSAVLLKAVWLMVKSANNLSIFRHFEETLNDIGNTCIQGCSHRLFIDYVALKNDKVNNSSSLKIVK